MDARGNGCLTKFYKKSTSGRFLIEVHGKVKQHFVTGFFAKWLYRALPN